METSCNLPKHHPPSPATDALKFFDEEVQQCFALCTAIEIWWSRSLLNLTSCCSCLHCMHLYHPSAFAALTVSIFSRQLWLLTPRSHFPMPSQLILLWPSPSPAQKVLSGMIEDQLFANLMDSSSHANRAHFLLVAAPLGYQWSLELIWACTSSPSPMSTIKWWLGLDTSGRSTSTCPFCPDTTLDPLGHHAVT